MATTDGQYAALKQILMNYANDEQAGVFDAIRAIETVLGCEDAATLRDQLVEINESLKYIAHPLIEVVNEEAKPQEDVKTLRDEFAMAAMTGSWATGEVEQKRVASWAYQVADAMLEARKK